MTRNPSPWTKDELAILGTRPDAEVADLADNPSALLSALALTRNILTIDSKLRPRKD